MDKIQILSHALAVLLICHGFADGLIGLRPPNQAPHSDKVKKPYIPKPVSPKPAQVHHTQLHSPYQYPEKTHNYTVIETELKTNDKCQTLSLLRCSAKLLNQSIHNATEVCSDIKQFTDCILGSLKDYGRREYITGMVILDDLRFAARNTFRCHGNDSTFSHMRHRVSKRHDSVCCTEGVMNCAVQTFFKMSTNGQERCHLVSFYDVCMNEISNTCGSDTLITSYPVFVVQLKRQCSRRPLKRKKRSKLRNTVFFGT